MNLLIKEFSFEEYGRLVEGALFYDADILKDDIVEEIIYTYGTNMNNMVLKEDVPCFFLPKGQSDLLRKVWVPEKVNSVINDIVNKLEEYESVCKNTNISCDMAVESCINIANNYLDEYNKKVKEM